MRAQGAATIPTGKDFLMLKWRYDKDEETSAEYQAPVSINCWPTTINKGFEVSVSLELTDPSIELHDVTGTIPLP